MISFLFQIRIHQFLFFLLNLLQLLKSVSLGNEKILIGCIYRPPLGTDHLKNIKIDNEIIKSLYYAKKKLITKMFLMV